MIARLALAVALLALLAALWDCRHQCAQCQRDSMILLLSDK